MLIANSSSENSSISSQVGALGLGIEFSRLLGSSRLLNSRLLDSSSSRVLDSSRLFNSRLLESSRVIDLSILDPSKLFKLLKASLIFCKLLGL